VVRQDCLKGTGTGDSPDFWTLATVAELDLIDLLNNDVSEPDQINRMLASYERAEARCETTQQRKSARKNTGLLLDNLARTAPERASALQAAINQKLRPARIALFSGHRIDGPNRPTPRFPSERVSACHSALAEFIAAEKIDVGYSSAANGGDLIFIDELLKQGCGAHVVIPFAEEQFRNTTLATNSEGVDDSSDDENQWVAHFDRLVRGEREGAVLWHASQSTVDAAGMDPYYAHTNRVILGMGRLKAKELDGELVALAVMEPSEDRSIGGTYAAVSEWRKQHIPNVTWSPMSGEWHDGSKDLPLTPEEDEALHRQSLTDSLEGYDSSRAFVVNRTLLFADVMGFSGFSDSQVAAFCEGVLGGVNELVETSDSPPVELNTWGDGLFMVFENAVAGANFALRLCELMKIGNRDGRWGRYGLPEELFMRVSLHSSPVRQLKNPLTLKASHWGHNVSIAARIEPITPPNQVYGTASTAALIAAEGAAHLAADFVGMVPLAKAFGTLELFRIHRGS
jgi:class 3 adenylate cyclase